MDSGACYTNQSFVDDDGSARSSARRVTPCAASGVVLNIQGLKAAADESDVPPLQCRARFRELLLGDQPCQNEDRYGSCIVTAMAMHCSTQHLFSEFTQVLLQAFKAEQ
ncbi:hypothetical protein SRHO_G00234170 [Serrasalmus rhombeus]